MKEGWILGKLVDLVRDSAKLTRMGCTRRPLTVRRHYLTNESGYGPRQQPCAQLTLLNAFTIEKLHSFRLHQPPPSLPVYHHRRQVSQGLSVIHRAGLLSLFPCQLQRIRPLGIAISRTRGWTVDVRPASFPDRKSRWSSS